MKKGSKHTEETKAKISESTKDNAGRPTLYREAYDKQAYRLSLLGFTDIELAEFFNISESTLNEWKIEYQTFSESIKEGKVNADSEVVESLFKRAKGYTVQDVKIFQFQGSEVVVPYTKIIEPDVSAASLWLRNRQPRKWRDKIDITGGVDENGEDKPVMSIEKNLSTELLEQILKELSNK